VAGLRLTPQMLMMFCAFLGSPQRTKLLLLGVAIVAVIGATPSAKSDSTHGINHSITRSHAKT
jgi:hypothetical protein